MYRHAITLTHIYNQFLVISTTYPFAVKKAKRYSYNKQHIKLVVLTAVKIILRINGARNKLDP